MLHLNMYAHPKALRSHERSGGTLNVRSRLHVHMSIRPKVPRSHGRSEDNVHTSKGAPFSWA